jgi:hypothetical protein
VHDRIARSEPCQTWASFEAANPDLLGSSAELMNRFYDESTWRSDTARKTFLLPDRGTRPRS